jgi:hypothetical protein
MAEPMRTSRALVISAIAIAILGVVANGCYRPNVVSGGLVCAPGMDGGICPEGFHCSKVDNHCYAADAGPEVVVCTDASPTLFSVCDDPPPSGSECNPACQKGCSCGRCTVSGSKAVCSNNPGSKAVGELCDLSNDNCAVGLGCVKDGCGTNLGRCRQFCRSSAECTGGCNILVCAISVCEPPAQTCNPVGTGSGCPDPALACFLEGTATICDCPGTRVEGDGCTFSPECGPGLTCIGYMGLPACHVVCSGPQDCTGGQVCDKTIGGTFGFCRAP